MRLWPTSETTADLLVDLVCSDGQEYDRFFLEIDHVDYPMLSLQAIGPSGVSARNF